MSDKWACRGVRGAVTVEANDPDAILAATRDLLHQMVQANGIRPEDVASAIFSMTPDLNAAFPAQAARQLGWHEVALFDAQEIAVPNGLPRCIRVLLHWNTGQPASQIQHIYLRDAQLLRPDRFHQVPTREEAS